MRVALTRVRACTRIDGVRIDFCACLGVPRLVTPRASTSCSLQSRCPAMTLLHPAFTLWQYLSCNALHDEALQLARPQTRHYSCEPSSPPAPPAHIMAGLPQSISFIRPSNNAPPPHAPPSIRDIVRWQHFPHALVSDPYCRPFPPACDFIQPAVYVRTSHRFSQQRSID